MDYANWPTHQLRVLRLKLDDQNPRLPWNTQGGTQKEIRHHLILHDIAEEIAESISENGFFVHELPIVVKSDVHHVVVEGNRRLAALQALADPAKAPKSYRKKFIRLRKKIGDKEFLEKIKVMIAPDRDAAEKIIFAKHAKGYTKGWEPIMKARFFVKELGEGLSFEEIADMHGVSSSEVERSAKLLRLYEYAASLDYPAEIKKKINDEYSFPLSTLARLFDNAPFLKEFELGTDGVNLTFLGSEQRFEEVIRLIATDLVADDEKLTSRALNDTGGRKIYFDGLKKRCLIWDGEGGGSVRPKSPQREATPSKKPTPEPKPKKPRERHTLVPQSFEFSDDSSKLSRLLLEGQEIRPNSFPLASAHVLRSILEHATYRVFWANQSGEEMFEETAIGGRAGLSKLLNKLKDSKRLVPDAQLRKAIVQFLNTKVYHGIDNLNFGVHNEYITLTAEELRAYWPFVEKIVRLALDFSAPAAEKS